MEILKKILSVFLTIIKIIGIPIIVFFAGLIIFSHLSFSPLPAVSSVSDFNYLLHFIGASSNIPVVSKTLSSIELSPYKSELEFDSDFYPYYGMLNDGQKLVYKQFYNTILNRKPSFIIHSENTTQDEAETIWTSVLYDHPELFWASDECAFVSNKTGSVTLGAKLDYYDFGDFEKAKRDFESSANSILNSLGNVSTTQGKEMLIHDKLVGMAKYDTNADYNQSAYSALVSGRSVCAGYSRAFQYLLIKLDIPCYYVTGWSEENHAWNIINIDGEFYNVDVTWDAALGTHAFFNRTDTDFVASHTRTDQSVDLPVCNGITYRNADPIPPIIVTH